jgi:hypothetical protein
VMYKWDQFQCPDELWGCLAPSEWTGRSLAIYPPIPSDND